jgi:spermidine synthase
VHIPLYGATWGFACASDVIDLRAIHNMQAEAIDERLAARNIGERRYYDGAMHQAMLALPAYIRELIA